MRFYSERGNRVQLSLGVAVMALVAPPALAQQSPEAPAEASATTSAENEDSEIIVLGTRRSLEDALATKRISNQIIDSISAEGVGRLPDLNLAESLQRLPGVQINRSATRRLGTVSIRGLPGDFAQTLINGQYLASPDVSNFSFGTVRSEVFSGIDVIKAQGADQPTGGLSGLVNLRTGSAMSARQGLNVTADATYEELPDKFAPGGAITGAYQIIPGILAVRGGLGYKKSIFRIDNFSVNTYDRIAGAATTDNADDVFRPRQIRLPSNLSRTESISGSFGVEWKPTSQLTAEILGFYNDYRGETSQNEFAVEAVAASSVTATAAAVPTGAFGSTISSIRIANPQVTVDTRGADDRLKTGAITGILNWRNDDWTVVGTAHYTKATRDFRNSGYQSLQRAIVGGAGNGIVADINTGLGNLSDAAFSLAGTTRRVVDLSQPFNAPTGPNFRELSQTNRPSASFTGGFRMQDESEDELSFQIDIKKEFEFGPLDAIRIGGLYREKTQDQTQSLSTLFGTNRALFNNDFYDYSNFSGAAPYLNGKASGIDISNAGEFDVRRLNDILRPPAGIVLPVDTTNNGVADYFVGKDGFVNIRDSTALSLIYNNKQKIYGGYVMMDVDQQLFPDVRLRGNFGVRYEFSERATQAQGQPNVLGLTYDNLLPSANAVVEFGDNLLLRASYTETMRRPQVDSFAVLRSVAVDGTGTLVTVGLGAADLQPFTSTNFDVSLEWYNRAGSSISFLAFRKEVSNFAGSTRICPEDGGGFGFGPLSQASGVCRTTGITPSQGTFPQVNVGALVNINVTANQDTFTLDGFEVSLQQNLDFLPAPFNGFGGQINYTQVNFDTASATFRLGEISKHTVNAIIYYEVERFGVRAAYNYRSGYFLGSASTQTGADRSVNPRSQLDLSASFNISDRLSLTAEAFNVTNELLVEYEGAENRVRNYFEYGRTLTAGVRYRF